jgi:hypothetical protein
MNGKYPFLSGFFGEKGAPASGVEDGCYGGPGREANRHGAATHTRACQLQRDFSAKREADRDASFEFVTHSVISVFLLPSVGNAVSIGIEFCCLAHKVHEVDPLEWPRAPRDAR